MRRGSTWAVVDERPKPPSCFTDGGRDAATSDASGDSGRGAGRCGGGLGRRTQLRGASYLAVWVCAMAHGDRGTSPLSRARKVRVGPIDSTSADFACEGEPLTYRLYDEANCGLGFRSVRGRET